MTGDQLKSTLIGSAKIGGGLGLLAVLADAIRSEKRKQKVMEGTEEGDLQMILPKTKVAVLSQALAGVAVATGTAYAVQQLYRKWKSEQLSREVGESTGDYLEAVQKAASLKLASQGGGIGTGTLLADLPFDLSILLPIAAATATYGSLDHIYPKVEENKKQHIRNQPPRRIVIKGYGAVPVNGPGDGPLAKLDQQREADRQAEEEIPKLASLVECSYGPSDVRRANEAFGLLVTNLPHMKEANSGLTEILGAWMRDPERVHDLVKQAGILAAVSACKGGSEDFMAADEMDKRAAINSIYDDMTLVPSLNIMALSEFYEFSPVMTKMAALSMEDPDDSILMTKFASEYHVLETREALACFPHEKLAARFDKDMANTLQLDTPDTPHGPADDPEKVYSAENDPIDQFLAGRKIRG